MTLEYLEVVMMLKEQVAVLMLVDRTNDEDPSTTEAVMKTRATEAWIEDLKNTLLAKREC